MLILKISLIIVGIAFILFGYFIYFRRKYSLTMLFIIAFVVVVFSMTSGNVDNTLMIVCSYIPFTSPMSMFTRLAMSNVPWYSVITSVIILIASTVGIGVLSAKIYRAGVLMYGSSPKISNIIKAVWKA